MSLAAFRLSIYHAEKLLASLENPHQVEALSLMGAMGDLLKVMDPETAVSLNNAFQAGDEKSFKLGLKDFIAKARKNYKRHLVKKAKAERIKQSNDIAKKLNEGKDHPAVVNSKYTWYIYIGPKKMFYTRNKKPIYFKPGSSFGIMKMKEGRFGFFRFGMKGTLPLDGAIVKQLISHSKKKERIKRKAPKKDIA